MPKCPLWILIVSLAFLHAPARGETQAFFTSQVSVEEKMSRLIGDSRRSINIALFELRSPGLIEALKQAERRGVRVRLVLDTSHRQDDLTAGDVRWVSGRHSGGAGVMHHKFAIFDQSQVVTGSYNWTPGAEHANYENALLTDDKETVESYQKEFERLWERSGMSPHVNPRKNPRPASRKKRYVLRVRRKKSKKPSRQAPVKSARINVLRSVPPKL